MVGISPTQLVMGIIAVLSFFCNGALCLVVLKKRSMLKSSYNLVIFTLAVTDTLTGIFLLTSPNYVLGENTVPVPPGLAGQLFCRVIYINFLVWVFSKFSVLLVTCMAIERWFVIARPTRYQILFTNRRVIWYMIAMFVWCLSWTSTVLFESPMEVTKSGRKCVFRELLTNLSASRTWVVTYCVVTVLVPFLITMATYFHLRLAIRKQIHQDRNIIVRKRAELEIRLSRMGVLVALFMAICFVPNQISFILVRFNVLSLLSPGHNATVVLSMLNSCINPFIYCATNRAYRREFKHLFCTCVCRQNRVAMSSTEEMRLPREHLYRDLLHGFVQHAAIPRKEISA